MQPGRCITGDYGHVMGCYADVTAYVSDTCDYRQNCTMLVATMDSVAQPCAKDFKSYLQAYYVCVRGIGRKCARAADTVRLSLSQASERWGKWGPRSVEVAGAKVSEFS